MIYNIQWGVFYSDLIVSQWNRKHYPKNKMGDFIKGSEKGKMFADFIKEGKNDTFLFILVDYSHLKVASQKDQFDSWINENDLRDYIVLESSGISNPVHPERKYNLYFVVMQTKEHDTPVEIHLKQKEIT
jgi:hypothetical protein